jgi:formate dehydrogenase beta subunit
MPAGSEEVIEAVEEGVRIAYLTAPVKIEGNRLTCIRMRLGDADASGRPMPIPLPGSEYGLEFDTLIRAIGQVADAASLNLKGRKDGTVCVGEGNAVTPERGIFAGGDAVIGPSTIIEAIAQGREACISIDRFLGGAGIIQEALSVEENRTAPEAAPRGTKRPGVRKITLKRRRATFDPIELAYKRKSATAEASRCLSCDLHDFDVAVNGLICKDCGYCREVCIYDIFAQSDDFNPSGYKPAVVVNVDKCVGCLRCLYICPDFAITVREKE